MPPDVVVLAGPSGAGKTVVGRALAARLGAEFHDADDFHPAANRAKMAAGVALTDEDRAPWLEALRAAISAWRSGSNGHVLACSALKASYRRALSGGDPAVRFVFLRVDPALLAARLAARRGHFFAPSLLRSQLDAMEEPSPAEALIVEVEKSATPEETAARIADQLTEG